MANVTTVDEFGRTGATGEADNLWRNKEGPVDLKGASKAGPEASPNSFRDQAERFRDFMEEYFKSQPPKPEAKPYTPAASNPNPDAPGAMEEGGYWSDEKFKELFRKDADARAGRGEPLSETKIPTPPREGQPFGSMEPAPVGGGSLPSARDLAAKFGPRILGRVAGPIAGLVANSTPLSGGMEEEAQMGRDRVARNERIDAKDVRDLGVTGRLPGSETPQAASSNGEPERADPAALRRVVDTQKLLAPGGLAPKLASRAAEDRLPPAASRSGSATAAEGPIAPKGSAFSGARDAAKAAGKKNFAYGGKSYSTSTGPEVKRAATAKVNPPAKAGPDLNEKMLSLYRSDPTFASLTPAEQVARASTL